MYPLNIIILDKGKHAMENLEAIWNTSIEEVRRQYTTVPLEYDDNIPVNHRVDPLDACREGSRQILSDKNLVAMFKLGHGR